MTMRKPAVPLFQLGAIAAAFALSGAAQATTNLTNEYTVTASATAAGANTWTFDYSVLNNNQGIGGQTGLDGFTIFVPLAATLSVPALQRRSTARPASGRKAPAAG